MLDQLLKECRKNNKQAQGQLYKFLAPKLFAVCLKYSRSYEEAQDNLQESFLIIFNKINQFNDTGSFEGWAKRIVINYTLQQYRSQVMYFEIISEKIADDENVELDDENVSMDLLLKIIQELPDRYRLVFNLYVIDGYSHKEIAEMLDISEGTSKSNLSRAKLILKEKLQQSQTFFSQIK